MLSFFPRGVLDEILNLIESVSEGFPSYFCMSWGIINNSEYSLKTKPIVQDATVSKTFPINSLDRFISYSPC